MSIEKEIARLQEIEEKQRKIIEKQTGEKPHVVTFNSEGEVEVDTSSDKQRKLWQE
ncbi:hypothetical protein QNH47_13190 [Virgibacillus halodenitrificans]|uniref:hypothetical protein n=1 Tax=Virgibacillus halodenitrificans TaxID=1482 RepID=UPI0024C0BBB8|nr:hypothetical protein [Virgibacillus halodenitrificans]WHX25122.1 hypothetical protein QNH47_13190 [Virgibacillus halodenitrificans]